jgi:hypothetical protein
MGRMGGNTGRPNEWEGETEKDAFSKKSCYIQKWRQIMYGLKKVLPQTAALNRTEWLFTFEVPPPQVCHTFNNTKNYCIQKLAPEIISELSLPATVLLPRLP